MSHKKQIPGRRGAAPQPGICPKTSKLDQGVSLNKLSAHSIVVFSFVRSNIKDGWDASDFFGMRYTIPTSRQIDRAKAITWRE